VHHYNIKKSGTITGKAAILEPQNESNIWVASVDATQKPCLGYLTFGKKSSFRESYKKHGHFRSISIQDG